MQACVPTCFHSVVCAASERSLIRLVTRQVTSAEPSEPAFDIPINLETASAEEWIDAFKSKFEAERSKVRELQEKLEAATECAPGDARSQKLVNDKRKLALEVQALKDANLQAPPPPPPSRTDWTRLVPPPVLTGHASSLLPY